MSTDNIFRNAKGNVAIIFAITIVPLLLAVGCAVDYSRALNAQATLQNAADAAVLAAGASDKVTDTEVTALVNQYLAGNKYDLKLKAVDAVTVKSTGTAGGISVHVAGEVSTTFMSLAGYSSIDVGADTGIKRSAGAAPLELALVLDTTGSMAGSKLDGLKAAAKDLAAAVLSGSTNAKVGVVPFSRYINVGVSQRSESWVTVPPDYTEPGACWDTYPNKTGCTITTYTCYNEGVASTCSSESCTGLGAPVQVCGGSTDYTWYGCLGSRPDPDNAVVSGAMSTPYPGFLGVGCGAQITDMTNNASDITTAIDGLSAGDETYIPSGLIWGWNLLEPEKPYDKAASVSDISAKGGKKALVLMSDGANTLVSWPNGVHWSCMPDCSATDTLTSQICENIKASGIVVYTVLFDVSDPKIEKMLGDCSSGTGMSFVASDSAGLMAAFKKIGKSLGQLRLSQ